MPVPDHSGAESGDAHMDRETWKFAGLVIVAAGLTACNSMSGPWRYNDFPSDDMRYGSTYTYPRQSVPYAPRGYATPDKLEGSQQPAVSGPTS
jgi:hypothetical protein